jgi:hypothetical protein
MQIARINPQPKNTSRSRVWSLDSGSNVTVWRDVQSPKHQAHRSSTEAGTEIDWSDSQILKAFSLIRRSFDPDSKEIAETDLQRLKLSGRISSIVDGMTTCSSTPKKRALRWPASVLDRR